MFGKLSIQGSDQNVYGVFSILNLYKYYHIVYLPLFSNKNEMTRHAF